MVEPVYFLPLIPPPPLPPKPVPIESSSGSASLIPSLLPLASLEPRPDAGSAYLLPRADATRQSESVDVSTPASVLPMCVSV